MDHRFELSICLDDLRQETKTAMDRARRMGFRAIDASALRGPISPEELSRTGQRHLLKHLGDLGLRLGSLRGPAGGAGYADPVAGERRLDRARAIVRLAAALRVPVVSTTLGQPSPEADSEESGRIREAMLILADEADREGVSVTVETSGVTAARLGEMVGAINCPRLAVCCDSGAMIMRGEDPHAVARSFPGRIRLVRARDATTGSGGAGGEEVAPGSGQLDAPRLLANLEEAGFAGDIVLTRTGGVSPADDLLRMKQEFERFLARAG